MCLFLCHLGKQLFTSCVNPPATAMAPKAKSSARVAMAAASSVQAEAVAAEPERVISSKLASAKFGELEKGGGTEVKNLTKWDLLVAYTNTQPTPEYKNRNVDRLYSVLEVHPFLKAKAEAGDAKQVPTKVSLSKSVVGNAA